MLMGVEWRGNVILEGEILHASVGKGGSKSAKKGPGGASTAILPPGKLGGVVEIGSLLGPVPTLKPKQ